MEEKERGRELDDVKENFFQKQLCVVIAAREKKKKKMGVSKKGNTPFGEGNSDFQAQVKMIVL